MVIFFGNYTDEETYNLIVEKGVRDLSQASRLFQEKIILNYNDRKNCFISASILPINNKFKAPEKRNNNINYFTYKPKNIFSIAKCYRSIKKFIESYYDSQLKIISYAINPILSAVVTKIKKHKKIEFISICSELPEFRRYKKGLISIIKRNILKYYNRFFDKYIVLTEYMMEYLPKNKRYYVLEGFAPNQIIEKKFPSHNIVMYAGGLAKDNGIELMVEAVSKSALIEELWIFGKGELSEYLKSLNNPKIKYFGSVNNDIIKEYECDAKVLLNTRNPNEVLSRFSFPSKVLEYLSTGTLTLSTRLPGIPKEYFDYLIPVDYNADDLAAKIDMILSLNDSEYIALSRRIKSFIYKKTAKNRAKELKDFVES